MLTYNLMNRKDLPLYIFLYNSIKEDIEKRLIKPHEKLPSKRGLADHLKVSIMTVQNAYAQLLAEGYIYSRVRSGYYAAELEQMPTEAAPAEGQEATEDSLPDYFMDFCENSINISNFPFSIWSRQMRQILNERDSELLRRMPTAGVFKLRKAIAEFLHRFRGITVTPDHIVIGAGTEYLYGMLIKLLGRDKIYAVEDPGYQRLTEIYLSEGVACRYIGLDQFGMRVDELEKSDADIAHMSPSHHFPTGVIMPVRRRQEILAWAYSGANRYIIEDDYDSEFRFTGRAVPTLQSIDTQDKVIYMNTFSKTISPAIRISYMVLPSTLMQKNRQELGFLSCTVPSFEQYTLAKFIESGSFERHVNRVRKAYKSRRDCVIEAIESSSLSEKAEILEEDAGLHFILKLHTKISDEEVIRRAEERGIRISSLSEHCHQPQNASPSMFIINYSGIDLARIGEAVEILASIVRQ